MSWKKGRHAKVNEESDLQTFWQEVLAEVDTRHAVYTAHHV